MVPQKKCELLFLMKYTTCLRGILKRIRAPQRKNMKRAAHSRVPSISGWVGFGVFGAHIPKSGFAKKKTKKIPGACVPAAELDVVFDTGAGFPENIRSWWFRNPVNSPVDSVEVGSLLSYCLQRFIHLRWLGMGFFHQQYLLFGEQTYCLMEEIHQWIRN